MNITKTLFFVFVLVIIKNEITVAQDNTVQHFIIKDDLKAFKASSLLKNQQQEYLFESVEKGAYSIVEYLISNGADVLGYNEGGSTPLIIAVSKSDEKMVELLLKSKADPNQKERKGLEGTPLMYSSINPNTDIANLLIDRGAEVNTIDVNKDPAINWAAYYGNIALMKLLIEHSADLSIQSKHGTSLDVGLRLWHADSVMDVFRPTEFSKKIDSKTKSLLYAIKSNDIKKVEVLLKKGANANAKDGLGTPLLQIAVESGSNEIVKCLLSHGANPNQMNRVGQVPLAFASRFKHLETTKLLLDAGADPNKTNMHYRLTSLMGAAVGGDVKIGRLLLDAGAKMNATDSVNQCTALHWAMFYGNIPFAIMLLHRGADYQKKVLGKTYTGYTLAKAYGYAELVREMEHLDAKDNPLIGSWKINQIHYIYKDTTVVVDTVSQGRLTVTPNRYHIIYNPWLNPRVPFKVLSKPTDTEIKHAFQTLVFNTGTYSLNDTLFTTTSDIAKVPGFEGGMQYYSIEVDGDKLQLIMKDETYPNGEKPEWYQKLQILFKLNRE
ncbi:MAG: ankyrin repeat domain-containing protein [Cyclobacteriaceae bacterium]|nr:ankyrin repeat domain-containing protein [Cyclobacteriaceae bacterium]